MSNWPGPDGYEQWLIDMFEYEYCAECGGDADAHYVIDLGLSLFARCKVVWPAPSGNGWVDAWNGWYDSEEDFYSQVTPEDLYIVGPHVLKYGEDLINEEELERRVSNN